MDPENERDFVRWLERRRMEPPSSDFARRIISASARLPQRRGIDLYGWLKGLFSEFVLPQPAYALAPLLILGLALGFATPRELTGNIVGAHASPPISADDEDTSL